jgi:hypothetical protein
MSYGDLELPIVDEGMYKPQISQGVVLLKGKVDTILLAMATASENPCYKFPRDCPNPNLQCRNRGIGYQRIPDSGFEYSEVRNIYTPDDYGETGTPVMTSLYGQGEKNNMYDLYNTIRPIGIVYNGNDANNTSKFNIQIGGTIEVSNNGPHRINVGDIIYADLPDTEPRECENGNKELVFKVYRSEIHKSNHRGVRKCLDMMDDTNYKGYHRKFEELSEELLELKLKIHLVHTRLYDAYLSNMAPSKRGELLNEQNRIFDLIESGADYSGSDFRTSSNLYGPFKDFFFPKKDTNLTLSKDNKKSFNLNVYLQELNDRYAVVKAEFLEFQLQWIIGKACTSANPGQDFVIMLTNYSL